MNDDKNKQRYSNYLDSKIKRCFDIIICLLLFLPALTVVIFLGLIILIIEGRPVFFIHWRAGRNGQLFLMPKLRTLRSDANPYKPSPKSDNEPFFTITGKFLRRCRLDELPQLFCVLTGRMSLVGPRPELPSIVATYAPLHKKRLTAKPGITGLWQVRGNHKVAIHQDIKYDLYYLRKAGFRLDMKILVMTIPFVLNPKRAQNIYEDRIYTYNISMSE